MTPQSKSREEIMNDFTEDLKYAKNHPFSSPMETILKPYRRKRHISAYCGASNCNPCRSNGCTDECHLEKRVRSSLASILLEAERRMPKNYSDEITETYARAPNGLPISDDTYRGFLMGRRQTIDDCRAVLRKMVEEIIEKE